MDAQRLLAGPATYLDQITEKYDFVGAAELVHSLLPAGVAITEVFCRTGSLGYQLQQLGRAWKGFDSDADMIAIATQKVGLQAQHVELSEISSASVAALLGWFAPLSMIAPADLPRFAKQIDRVLQPGGVAVLEDWLQPTEARPHWALMDIYDGADQKLVRSCVPKIEGQQAIFGFDWMIAEQAQGVRRENTVERRWLHRHETIRTSFSCFQVSLQQLDTLRVWRFLKG